MVQSKQINSRHGNFALLIDEKDSDLTEPKLYVTKQRWGKGPTAFTFIPIALRDKNNRHGSDHRYVHLLVAERCLGRSLKKGELIHHLNGNKFDCRRSNLLLCTFSIHGYLHTRMSVEFAKNTFQSPLGDGQLQLLHQLLDRNTQDISGMRRVL